MASVALAHKIIRVANRAQRAERARPAQRLAHIHRYVVLVFPALTIRQFGALIHCSTSRGEAEVAFLELQGGDRRPELDFLHTLRLRDTLAVVKVKRRCALEVVRGRYAEGMDVI